MLNNASDKVLCVDDEDNILAMFHRTLGRIFSIVTVNSGKKALDLLADNVEFAVIISDYSMPSINGVEFLKLAREISPNSVQILLTGNIELDIAVKAVNETNVFRYLPKPCSTYELRKVISDALNQYHLIIDKLQLTLELERKNQELLETNALLAKQKNLLEYELEMAKIVYNKLYSYGHSDLDGMDYIIKAKETAGGDFLLTHINQSTKSFYLILGDLTGHGLSYALAVLLVTEIFDTICGESPSIEQLATSINDKMCQKLPTGLFCAALLIKFDWAKKTLDVWLGWMPDVFFLDQAGNILNCLPANNLPLGVLAHQDFTQSVCSYPATIATSIFAYTDGVIEQRNQQQAIFGHDLLRDTLLNTPNEKRHVDEVLENISVHQQKADQDDDISMVELHLLRLIAALEKI